MQAIMKMPKKQVLKLQSHMLDACLAFEFGTDYRAVARRAKASALGQTKKALDLIANADAAAMERLSLVMIEDIK